MNYTFQELCKKEDYSSFQGENYYFDYLAFGTIGKSRLLEYVVQVLPSVSVEQSIFLGGKPNISDMCFCFFRRWFI